MQIGQITSNEVKARGLVSYEVAADVDPDRLHCAITNKLGDFAPVAAADVKYRQVCDVA